MGSTTRSLARNTTTGSLFANNQVAIEVLLIGGGGGGACASTGALYGGFHGGGSGGLVYKDSFLTSVGAYTVTIGAGGAAATSLTASEQNGSIGGNSVFGSLTAFGGGAGPADGTTSGSIYGGGSEGGYQSLIPAAWNGGGGTIGQGNPVLIWFQQPSAGAGGGGVWSPGGKSSKGQDQGGFGGQGTGQFHTWLAATSLGVDTSSRRYIGGGGGGGHSLYYGTPYNKQSGGVGGGGHPGSTSGQGTASVAGVANTGGGGAGSSVNGNAGQATLPSAGGSGLCIVRYTTGVLTATGGTTTTSGGFTYHAFTSSGTWTRTA